MKAFAALLVTLLMSSCTGNPPGQPAPPPGPVSPAGSLRAFLEHAGSAEIRARAISQAKNDIGAGSPHVGWCGTIGVYRPNIPPDKERFVADLPRLDLPSGCTDPLAEKGATFAAAYNGELVKHLPLATNR